MCGISGQLNIGLNSIAGLSSKLEAMNKLIEHRGPDGEGIWIHPSNSVGFAHRRLSIIDIDSGKQPMVDDLGNVVCFNGEIYNYRDLRKELQSSYSFRTNSDTEVILAGYRKWGVKVIEKLRGMFAFALWNEREKTLLCARDRFGIKPFYYSEIGDTFIFCSEAKGILPFLPAIETDKDALQQYFTFQLCLGQKTLFKGIKQIEPGHYLVIKSNKVSHCKYWEAQFEHDWNHTKKYFRERLAHLLDESIKYHLISDVPVGCYLSGGIDSGIVAALSKKQLGNQTLKAFTGKFPIGQEYDESRLARLTAGSHAIELHEIEITSADFIKNMAKVMYHLDYPVAGPGSFPQYSVSQYASENVKVCLGGQGGDEIFGGYVRYLLAYFELCIKGAIEGTMHSGNFIVTYESIIPNLKSLQKYKPMMKDFWRTGLFEDREQRYFHLISRSEAIRPLINEKFCDDDTVFEQFKEIFCGQNVGKASYFDAMTNFDFKTLLPGLLQVEDRVSMAHGLESRVPLLDHPLIELAASIPSNIKFENGALKLLLRDTFSDLLPHEVLHNKDKMGFPVPLGEWMKGDLHDYIVDVFGSKKATQREYLRDGFKIEELISKQGKFDRNLWGLLSLELWQQQFHDKQSDIQGVTS